MAGDYVLYGGGITRSVAVEVILRELGLPYELVEIDADRGEHRAPGFLRINPAGYLPALATPSGEVLHENAAIMLWLAETHEAEALAPAPRDPQRGAFLSKLFFHTNDIQPAMKRYFFAARYTPDTDGVAVVREQARAAALDRWGVLNDYLETCGPLHLGDRFSLLDPHMAVWAAYGLESSDELLDRFAAVRRCFELAARRPKSGALILDLQRKARDARDQQ